jgi:hypothetical protein
MGRGESEQPEAEQQIDKLIYCQHASQQQVHKKAETLTFPITKSLR